MQVRRLGHFVIYTSNIDRSIRFYRDVLGYPLSHGTLPHAAIFSGGETHHEFIVKQVDSVELANKEPVKYHIGLNIGSSLDELYAARDELKAAGINITGSAQSMLTKSLYLQDPDGNEIELYVDILPPSREIRSADMIEPVWPLQL
jgi:catechol-2,3-dioxygenase